MGKIGELGGLSAYNAESMNGGKDDRGTRRRLAAHRAATLNRGDRPGGG